MSQVVIDDENGFALYQPLSGFDQYLSALGLFGLFKPRRKLLIEDQAFKCVFVLKTLKPQYLNIKIATDGDQMVREAMHVRVKYFNWRMREIAGAHTFTRGRRGSRKRLSYFFADPFEKVKRQRLWLKPPEGAKFVVLTFERGDYGERLGFSSKIKLKVFDEGAGVKDLNTAFQKIMVSRDRMRMTWFVDRLKNEAMSYYQGEASYQGQAGYQGQTGEITGQQVQPIAMAHKMLANMVYLWHGVEEKRTMMVIDDIAQIAQNGFTLGRHSSNQLTLEGADHINDLPNDMTAAGFEYGTVLTPTWDRAGLMSSQMRLEAMHLMRAVKETDGRKITLREGRQFLARLMVAVAIVRQTGWQLVIDVSETLLSEHALGEWYRWRSLKDWLLQADIENIIDGNVHFLVRDHDQKKALLEVAGLTKEQINIHK